MSRACVLAIDNGSQSTKVHIFDADGRVLASAQQPLRPCEFPEPGHVVHPGDDLWESIAAAARAAIAAYDGSADDIVAVGLCTIRFCRALLAADGRLIEPVLSWMDVRVPRPHVDVPEVAFVTTSSGYITHRLTGEFRDTAANYQGMWPIDQLTARWSLDPAAFAATGMPRHKLFDLVDPGELLGRVTSEAAAATGLRAGTAIYATANDKAVEALGAGIDEHTVHLSLGTYIAGMTVGTSPTTDSRSYWVNFASVPGGYLYESNGIRRGMWTVSWVRDLLVPPEAVLPSGVRAEQYLEAEAVRVAPGSGGLIAVLDWLAPTDAPYRRGAFLGFDGTQSRPHLYRAVLEGIALTMADHIEAMESALGRRFDSVVVTGGGAKSDLTMQIVADVLGRPSRRTEVDDSAGLGSAICAAVGVGLHPDFESARMAMVRPGRVFHPTPEGIAAYRPIRARYARVREHTDPLFHVLSAAGSAEARPAER